jgi:aminoglycoside phosphotransferase (APT) family kinase protein
MKLLEPRDIVDGVSVVEVSRRNRNFRILTGTGPRYLVKLGVGRERRNTIAHEAEAYRILGELDLPPVNACIPRLVAYDARSAALVLELVGDGEDLGSPRSARRRFSRRFGRGLGRILGALHRGAPADRLPAGARARIAAFRPVPFRFLRLDMPMFLMMSAGSIEFVRLIQTSCALTEALSAAAESWTEESLVHGDVRWENCVVAPRPSAAPLKLVDWEFAGVGDTAWDVGSALAEYLKTWVLSMPLSESAHECVRSAGFSLDAMQPSIGAFWQGYASARGVGAAHRRPLLLRSIRFAAARLLQIALERLQDSHRLTAESIYFAQLAENVILRPEEAATALFGLGASVS